MSDRVIIYGLSGWPYTIRAREAYKEHEFYSVIKDQRKLAEMLKISNGKRQVPVIVEGDKVNIGYGGTWCFWFSGRVCWEESWFRLFFFAQVLMVHTAELEPSNTNNN